VECVKTGQTPRETFEDGHVVNCILDAAYKGMQTKKWCGSHAERKSAL
jgi:hypothetical protein